MNPSETGRVFRASAAGLARVLGELEAEVMEFLWAAEELPLTARQVSGRVGAERGLKHITIVTVLNNLCRKALLIRRKRAGVLHYRPAVGREEFLEAVAREVAQGMLDLAPDIAVTSFVGAVAELGPGALEELRRLIQAEEHRGGQEQ